MFVAKIYVWYRFYLWKLYQTKLNPGVTRSNESGFFKQKIREIPQLIIKLIGVRLN